MTEYRDLYDKNRKLTGKKIKKGDPIPKGKYVNVVMVFIRNSTGHYLIQKRSKAKNGLYATTGGHAKSGETSLQAICSEVKEELGLDVEPSNFQLYYSGRSEEDQVFYDDYFLELSPRLFNIKPQKEEVSFVCWMQPWEIRNLFRCCRFMDNHYEEFIRLREWLKERDTKDLNASSRVR